MFLIILLATIRYSRAIIMRDTLVVLGYATQEKKAALIELNGDGLSVKWYVAKCLCVHIGI